MWVFAAEAVPTGLLEAAKIDGAGEFRTFLQIALPLLAPASVTVLLFSFVSIWNNYFLPLIMLKDPDWYPLTVGINQWNKLGLVGRERRPHPEPRDHVLAADDHPADHRVPQPAAVLAGGPVARRRQGLAGARGCTRRPPGTRFRGGRGRHRVRAGSPPAARAARHAVPPHVRPQVTQRRKRAE